MAKLRETTELVHVDNPLALRLSDIGVIFPFADPAARPEFAYLCGPCPLPALLGRACRASTRTWRSPSTSARSSPPCEPSRACWSRPSTRCVTWSHCCPIGRSHGGTRIGPRISATGWNSRPSTRPGTDQTFSLLPALETGFSVDLVWIDDALGLRIERDGNTVFLTTLRDLLGDVGHIEDLLDG